MIQCPWELSVVPRNQIVWRLWWPEWNNYSNCNNQSFHVYPNLFVHTVRISLTFPPDLISCLFFLQPLVCICPGHHRLLSFPLMIVWSPCIFLLSQFRSYLVFSLTFFNQWFMSLVYVLLFLIFLCQDFVFFAVVGQRAFTELLQSQWLSAVVSHLANNPGESLKIINAHCYQLVLTLQRHGVVLTTAHMILRSKLSRAYLLLWQMFALQSDDGSFIPTTKKNNDRLTRLIIQSGFDAKVRHVPRLRGL